jgi:hypothetical protein
VTDGDWEELGHAALESLEFEIARLAFIKLQDFSYLELIQDLQVGVCCMRIELNHWCDVPGATKER